MASTIEVLASALPKMLSARLSRGVHTASDVPALGGITLDIAGHLNAEVCSIFLLDDRRDSLVLYEAHGYDPSVIGTPHDLKSGLTGKIFQERVEFVLNYSVQDSGRGWAGKLDPQLKTYCWSLLGVPIISQRTNACLGVLKFENRRKSWSNIQDGRYLRDLIPTLPVPELNNERKRVCTAGEICRRVRAFVSMTQVPTVGQLVYISNRLAEAARRTSFEITESQRKAGDTGFNPIDFQSGMEAMIWCTNAIHHELDQLHPPDEHIAALRELQQLTHAFRLALSTYEPFTIDDLYLARAVAAMIGAAIDAGEAARAGALAILRHGLKSVACEFLNAVEGVVTRLADHDMLEQFQPFVGALYKSAIEISGACGVVGSDASHVKNIVPVPFEVFYSNFLLSRFAYYRDIAALNGKLVKFPQTTAELPRELRSARLPYAHGLIGGVLDCILLNAIEHGGNEIEFAVNCNADWIQLITCDNGPGIPKDRLADIRSDQSEIAFSERGGFGLKACRKVLKDAGFGMDISGDNGTQITVQIPRRWDKNAEKPNMKGKQDGEAVDS